jgi:large subunit ribosomal protein L29
MKQEEIIPLSLQEIKDKIAEEKSSLAKMKLNHAVSQIENPMTIRRTRKTVARLSAELTKRLKAAK